MPPREAEILLLLSNSGFQGACTATTFGSIVRKTGIGPLKRTGVIIDIKFQKLKGVVDSPSHVLVESLLNPVTLPGPGSMLGR